MSWQGVLPYDYVYPKLENLDEDGYVDVNAINVEDWMKVDDGSNHDIYYYSPSLQLRRRHCPNSYMEQYFEDDTPKYIFRERCTRCKTRYKGSSCWFRGPGKFAFSFNVCEACIRQSVTLLSSTLSSSSSTSAFTILNGEKVWEACSEIYPKNMLYNVKIALENPDRDVLLKERARDAKISIQKFIKKERDRVREPHFRIKCRMEYGVMDGMYCSWGFGDTFDEYFGGMRDGLPNGLGVKVFSDGTIYCGGFLDGIYHSVTKALWLRPNGLRYEGTFFNGLKHGVGTLSRPDGSEYTGQFANEMPHGEGKLTYNSGIIYEGRFRFGKRDGPGIMIYPPTNDYPGGKKEKGNFRDDEPPSSEIPPPTISERDEDTPASLLSNPPSLFQLSLTALSNAMVARKDLYPGHYITKNLSDLFKPMLCKSYLQGLPKKTISNHFMDIADKFAWKNSSEIVIASKPLSEGDIQALSYFCDGSTALSKLCLPATRLQKGPLVAVCTFAGQCINLQELDLSYVHLSTDGIAIIASFMTSSNSNNHNMSLSKSYQNKNNNNNNIEKGKNQIKRLVLAGCNIRARGVQVLCPALQTNSNLTDLNLSFNSIGLAGSAALASYIQVDTPLERFNIRGNDLGESGGALIAEALKYNRHLLSCVVADNSIGVAMAALISSRLGKGGTAGTRDSFCVNELDRPDNLALTINPRND